MSAKGVSCIRCEKAPVFHPATARSGAPSLQVEVEGGLLWVHSSTDPELEAQRQLERLDLDRRCLLVIVGGGLGRLAELAAAGPVHGVLVLEPPGDGFGYPGCPPAIERVAGKADELIACVTKRQMALGWPDLMVVHNAAYGRAFPDWAGRLISCLPPGRRASQTGVAAGDGTRPWPPRTVLLLDSGYYLVRECREAMAQLGMRVITVPLRLDGSSAMAGASHGELADAGYAERLVEAILTGKPELVLAINHLGLDRAGRIQDLLASFNLPLSVWYVDSPEYVLDGARAAVREDTFLFCWERAWLPRMRRLGFKHARHLPLAGSENFRKRGIPLRDFSLVAGSNTAAIAKWTLRLGCPPRFSNELNQLLRTAVDFPIDRLPDDELERRLNDGASSAFIEWLTPDCRRRLCSLLVLQATQEDRLALARRFIGTDFVLHGDAAWAVLDDHLPLAPPLEYYTDLAGHYSSVRLSLNCTSRQMPGAVNQRLFDAPLAGSLVLTDARPDLFKLFDADHELVVWRSPDEALALGQELRLDESRRRRMVERARRRILDQHLYRHRLRAMLDSMGEVLASPRAGIVAPGIESIVTA